MEAASNMQTPPDCKLSSANSEIATSNMDLAFNLQTTHQAELLDRRSLASTFKGSREQDISTGGSRTEEGMGLSRAGEGQANTSVRYSISQYVKKSALLLPAMYLLRLKENMPQSFLVKLGLFQNCNPVTNVRSLQATFGEFESMMKISQQKQEVTEKAVKQGESEINRISEVLQKLQNEILKDLSDGIHMVKDARERDFTSLENTVEERLTELTKSINDNIAVFTEVQQRSQDEINNMKAKVDSLEEADVYKHEIKVLKDAFDEMQASMKTKEKDIETLKSAIDSMESDVYTEVKELVNLKQEHEKFKEAADTEHLSLKALQEKVLRAENSIMQLPSDIKRLDEDILQVKADLNKWEENELFRQALETFGKNSEGMESRLRHIEDSLASLTSVAAQNSEKLQSFLSKEAEYENKLGTLEQSITALQGISDMDLASVTDVLKNLGESQTSLYNDMESLRRSISDLPSSGALQDVQKQISSLLDQGNLQMGQAHSEGYLEKFSSVEGSVDELRSSVSQVDSDLKMIRTAVDSLVSYSVKIENNENNLESVKSSIDDLRNDLERLFVKVEKIHEKV
nr:PREDICTED: cytoskeleton-associated protein 4 [Opisthocomus hoazin]